MVNLPRVQLGHHVLVEADVVAALPVELFIKARRVLAVSGRHHQDVKTISLIQVQQGPGSLVRVHYEDDAGKPEADVLVGQEVGPIQSLARVPLEQLLELVH